MTDEQIDTVLAEFRQWLKESGDEESGARNQSSFDLLTLVNEFTALRHEVKLLTKAARAQSEQFAAATELLQSPADAAPSEPDTELRAALPALLEAADILERSAEALGRLAHTPAATAAPSKPGLIGRLFHTNMSARILALQTETLQRMQGPWSAEQVASAASGLKLAQQRLSNALGKLDLEVIATVGEPFDPETMEVLEVLADSEHESGTVIDEVRRGYRWQGRVIRFAQVRVAK